MTDRKQKDEEFLTRVFALCGEKSAPSIDVVLTPEQIARAAEQQAKEFTRDYK